MQYQLLTQDEQDEIIVDFMRAQERELFSHEVNLARYEEMLKSLKPGKWCDNITKLRDETVQRFAEVKSIITATVPQLPPQARIDLVKSRLLTEKEKLRV